MTRFLFLFLCLGCMGQEEEKRAWQPIYDRVRAPTYRAIIPSRWVRKDPSPLANLNDTRKEIALFEIHDTQGTVVVFIHSFPTLDISERVPPQAQVARWQRQFHGQTHFEVEPVAHGGFSGLEFYGENAEKGVLAYTMVLDSFHYRALQRNPNLSPHLRADYTIKAQGPSALLRKYRREIADFARTFELAEGIE